MKKVLILGKGRSALAVRNLLKNYQLDSLLVDDSDPLLDSKYLSNFYFAVTSPAFASNNKWVVACKNIKLTIVSEIDLGLWILKANNVIGVTGTNGKTTCVHLINQLLCSSENNCFALGNIGVPLCEKVQEIKRENNVVLEISSFMLEQSWLISPNIAILTNITRDHEE